MKLTPHDYQEEIIHTAFEKLSSVRSVLIQAMTGAGKTVIMAFICQRWISEHRGKILITVHRTELVNQTITTLNKIGISAQPYVANTKRKHVFADVYVAMIETINRRIIKNRFDVSDISLVISDECHILVHQKIYEYFPRANIIGFTATPVIMKRERYHVCPLCRSEHPDERECCGESTEEWTRPIPMARFYDDIIIGPNFSKLQDVGQLVPEIAFVKDYADTAALKVDSTGDYSTASLDEAYGNDDAVFNVLLNYKELCAGKRTMIFNSSTKTNLVVYEKFMAEGLNVKMFDSVNTSDVSRKQLVEWFNGTEDAILCNVGVFTTGFDSREVQAIIMNRATKSLSLFLQIAGRGGRSSNKIYKDSFVLIDGGENIAEFGEWSSDRDWESIFFNGVGDPRAKRDDVLDVQDCENCGALFPKNSPKCPECGEDVIAHPPRVKQEFESEAVLEPIRKIPPPNARMIYEYTKRQQESIHFAFNILYTRIVDMFRYWRVTLDRYESSKVSGELDSKLRKMIYPVYHFLIKQNDIQTGSNRTLKYVVEKAKQKVEKYYYGKK